MSTQKARRELHVRTLRKGAEWVNTHAQPHENTHVGKAIRVHILQHIIQSARKLRQALHGPCRYQDN